MVINFNIFSLFNAVQSLAWVKCSRALTILIMTLSIFCFGFALYAAEKLDLVKLKRSAEAGIPKSPGHLQARHFRIDMLQIAVPCKGSVWVLVSVLTETPNAHDHKGVWFSVSWCVCGLLPTLIPMWRWAKHMHGLLYADDGSGVR